MQFELLRLSLLERPQVDAFQPRDPRGELPTREDWLRSTFSSPVKFEHRQEEFHYVPVPLEGYTVLAGRIGRQRNVHENEPPTAGLVETTRDSWRAITVLLDPRPHDDGQKVAIELNPEVASRPLALFESLVRHLNLLLDPPSTYLTEVSAISRTTDFWTFARENKGEITKLAFQLVAPNMFGIQDDYDAELRELKQHERARSIEMAIENPDGLEPETERVRKAVDYAARGGGSIRARTKRHRKFNSKSHAERVDIPEKKADQKSKTVLLLEAISAIFRT